MKPGEKSPNKPKNEKRSSNYLDDLSIIIDTREIKYNQEQIIQILKEEYFYLQSTVDKYDDKAITIKSWSISFSVVVFGSGLIEENKTLFLLACISSLLFWIIEGYWKTFQRSFYDRIYEIEKFLNGKNMKKFRLINTTGSFDNQLKKNLRSPSRFFGHMFWPQNMLPHIIIALASFFFWLYPIVF